jgi:divalent metal cation (Fe/Co/Zn/Cd) transporter
VSSGLGQLPLPPTSPLKESAIARTRWQRRARLLAWGGLAWHFVEFAIAVGAGIAASSIALVGFGVDSLIESLAGLVVIWLFTGGRLTSETAERRAQLLIAISFFVLAGYIAVEALRTLFGGQHPEVSWVGIGLAAVTAPTMPLLASAKRRVGRELGSAATVSEASQNMVCAYLSVALLIGLGANALFGWWWADPAAALVISAVALREGLESWRGESCGCCAPAARVPNAEPASGLSNKELQKDGCDDCCRR